MGHATQIVSEKILEQLLESVNFYRGVVLDSVEQELGDTPNWKFMRTRILRAFGDRGLEGRICRILEGTHNENIL